MPSIRKSLLQLIFSGSFMQRWNDKLRPMELFEIDKQAHKMMIAWLLFRMNAHDMDDRKRLDLGGRIVEGGLFEYLYRLVITDIKPPVFYQIKSNPDHYRRLSEWVLAQLTPRIQTLGAEFTGRMRDYISVPDPQDLAGRILFAAHIYASRYEFDLIKGMNPWDEELGDIESEFETTLRNHEDIRGVSELLAGTDSPVGRFGQLCGRLRFQQRWSQTPRIPETSVLGHMFVVAAFAYFFSLEIGACAARRQNNFFAGLFHDLPELLTRDIISPVKRSVRGIGEMIREYEDKEMERRVYALLAGVPGGIEERLRYFLGSGDGREFENTVRENGQTRVVGFEDLQGEYNRDRFDPRDGRLVKLCDNLAAFIEAYTALRNGITSSELQQSVWRIRNEYQKESYQHGVHIGSLLADFD